MPFERDRNLICAHADFAKFLYKILDICSQQKLKTTTTTKKKIYVYKNTYMSRIAILM